MGGGTSGWAVVGTGRVAGRMAAAVRASTSARLVSVLSRDADRGRAFVRELPGRAAGPVHVRTTMADLLEDESVDVLYVASPNGLHRRHVTAALLGGRDVLCEKPLAVDVDDCLAMTRLAARTGRRLGVAFQYRHHPAHVEVRRLVADGVLGRPVLAEAAVFFSGAQWPAWYADPDLAGGGVVPMSGVHRLDLLAHLLGERVCAVAALTGTRDPERGGEDTAAASLRMSAGTIASVRFCADAPHGGDRVAVHGTRGSAVLDGTTSQWWGPGASRLAVTVDGRTRTTEFPAPDLYLAQVEHFSACVRDGTDPMTTGSQGTEAVAAAVALLRSAATGRTVVVDVPGAADGSADAAAGETVDEVALEGQEQHHHR